MYEKPVRRHYKLHRQDRKLTVCFTRSEAMRIKERAARIGISASLLIKLAVNDYMRKENENGKDKKI